VPLEEQSPQGEHSGGSAHARAALFFALVVAATACTPVAAYDRARLAHPTMSTADVAGAAEGHVRAVHEGATGGSLGVGGGCGCN
jgi:Domain of unknown function (DUF4266)